MEYSTSLKKNFEFRQLYSKGRSGATPLLAVYCRKNRLGRNRLGVTVSRRLGNAVVRNRVRRKLREIYRTNEALFSRGLDIVVVARSASVSAGYWELKADFFKLCSRLGLLRAAENGGGS